MEKTVRLAIEGMHCGGCVTRVTNTLGKLEGVTVRKVEVGSAEAAVDETKTTAAQLVEAVSRIGFKAREA